MSDSNLVSRELNCPACESTFTFYSPKSRAYQLIRRDADFCPYYHGVNPLFYQVWVCPHCYFASYKDHWKTLTETERIGMRQLSSEAKEGLRFDFSQRERTLFGAIISFQLAYRCYQRRMPTAYDLLAGIQLRLAWLCRTGNDRRREIQHMGAAITHFAEAFDRGRNLSMSEAKIAYLLGELNRRVGNGPSAVEWLMRAIKADPSKGEIYRMGRDQLYEAKESIRFFEYLQGVDLLKALPIEQLAELAPLICSHRFVPGGVISRQGVKGEAMFLLARGEVGLHPGEPSDPPLVTLQPGQYFGEEGVLTGKPLLMTAVARTECEVLEIDRLAYKTVLAGHADLVSELNRVHAFRAQQVEQWQKGFLAVEGAEKGQETLMGWLRSFFELR